MRANASMDGWPWICFLPGRARLLVEFVEDDAFDGDGIMMARFSTLVGVRSLSFILGDGVMESRRARALLGVCAPDVSAAVTVGAAVGGAGLAVGVGSDINRENDDKSDGC